MSKKDARIPRFILLGAQTDDDDPLNPNGSTIVGWEVFVCLPGFDPSRQLTVRVIRPDGQVVERVPPAQGRHGLQGFRWLVDPGMPLTRLKRRAESAASASAEALRHHAEHLHERAATFRNSLDEKQQRHHGQREVARRRPEHDPMPMRRRQIVVTARHHRT